MSDAPTTLSPAPEAKKTPYQMAEIAASRLCGTCDHIPHLGEEFEDLQNNSEFCQRLDELVFECEKCNWWFEQGEMADDPEDCWICEDCAND